MARIESIKSITDIVAEGSKYAVPFVRIMSVTALSIYGICSNLADMSYYRGNIRNNKFVFFKDFLKLLFTCTLASFSLCNYKNNLAIVCGVTVFAVNFLTGKDVFEKVRLSSNDRNHQRNLLQKRLKRKSWRIFRPLKALWNFDKYQSLINNSLGKENKKLAFQVARREIGAYALCLNGGVNIKQSSSNKRIERLFLERVSAGRINVSHSQRFLNLIRNCCNENKLLAYQAALTNCYFYDLVGDEQNDNKMLDLFVKSLYQAKAEDRLEFIKFLLVNGDAFNGDNGTWMMFIITSLLSIPEHYNEKSIESEPNRTIKDYLETNIIYLNTTERAKIMFDIHNRNGISFCDKFHAACCTIVKEDIFHKVMKEEFGDNDEIFAHYVARKWSLEDVKTIAKHCSKEILHHKNGNEITPMGEMNTRFNLEKLTLIESELPLSKQNWLESDALSFLKTINFNYKFNPKVFVISEECLSQKIFGDYFILLNLFDHFVANKVIVFDNKEKRDDFRKILNLIFERVEKRTHFKGVPKDEHEKVQCFLQLESKLLEVTTKLTEINDYMISNPDHDVNPIDISNVFFNIHEAYGNCAPHWQRAFSKVLDILDKNSLVKKEEEMDLEDAKKYVSHLFHRIKQGVVAKILGQIVRELKVNNAMIMHYEQALIHLIGEDIGFPKVQFHDMFEPVLTNKNKYLNRALSMLTPKFIFMEFFKILYGGDREGEKLQAAIRTIMVEKRPEKYESDAKYLQRIFQRIF